MASEVLPLRKGGGGEVLAMLKGEHEKFWGSFYAISDQSLTGLPVALYFF